MGIQKEQLKEECPVCGALLLDTLQNRSLSLLQQASQASHKPVEDLSIEFQTAFQQIEENNTRLTFDIKKIDSLLTLNSCGSLCIIGEQKYTQLLIDRLCVGVGTICPQYSVTISTGSVIINTAILLFSLL